MVTLSSSLATRFLPPTEVAPAPPYGKQINQITDISFYVLAWSAVTLELLMAVVLVATQALLIGTLLITDTSEDDLATE